MKKKALPMAEDIYMPDVSRDNSMIRGKYKSTLKELQIMYVMQAKLQAGEFREENGSLIVEMTVPELKRAIRTNSGSFTEDLRSLAERLTDFKIRTYEQDTGFSVMVPIVKADYNMPDCQGKFRVRFNAELKDSLLYIKEKSYTLLPVKYMTQFESEYTFRLYELLKSSCYYPKSFCGKRNGKFRFDMSVSELRLTLGTVDARDESVARILSGKNPDYDLAVEKAKNQLHARWDKFKENCLDKPIAEINRSTDLEVTVSFDRTRRGGKVARCIFDVYCEKLDKEKDSLSRSDIPVSVDKNGVVSLAITEVEKFAIVCEVGSALKELKLTMDEIITLCEDGLYNAKKIKRAYRAMLLSYEDLSKVDSPFKWLRWCLRGGETEFDDSLIEKLDAAEKDEQEISDISREIESVKNKKEKKTSKKTVKKNSFNDFRQRDYDFEELERELLST